MTAIYYVVKKDWLLELRQTRFIGTPNHPHDVCAIARSREEMERMVALLKAADRTDWSCIPLAR